MEDELNVKELAFGKNETDLANLKAKADFRQRGEPLTVWQRQYASYRCHFQALESAESRLGLDLVGCRD